MNTNTLAAAVIGFLSQRGRPRESLAGRAGGWPAVRSGCRYCFLPADSR
mgnify:CR=1 FL=1